MRISAIPVLGIIGGIGSGKSSLPRSVRKFRLGILDADSIAHDLLREPEQIGRLVQEFGTGIRGSDGQISRGHLAEIVFGERPEQLMARQKLEAILHPAVRKECLRQIQTVPQDVDFIILDAALLLEAGWTDLCDALVFVDTALPLRQARVSASRGWSSGELERRERCQWPVDRKREFADFVIDNSGAAEASGRQFEEALQAVQTVFQRPGAAVSEDS